MKYTPKSIPDERTIQIMMGQAWNLAVASVGTIDERFIDWNDAQKIDLESRQQYFFDQLMEPYKPLLKARQEKEDLLNGKIRKKEIKEEQKGDDFFNYEKIEG